MSDTLLDHYSETNQDDFFTLASDNHLQGGQSFNPNADPGGSSNYKITSCKFYLKKRGSPTGNAVAKLYAHSGTYGTSSVSTGAALATSDNFDVSTLTTSFALVELSFTGSNQYVMSGGTKYVIDLEYSGGNSSVPNDVAMGHDQTSPSHAGNEVIDGAAFSSLDLCFYVYGLVVTTLIKTVDGLAIASVKTVDGLAIASVKSINGLS